MHLTPIKIRYDNKQNQYLDLDFIVFLCYKMDNGKIITTLMNNVVFLKMNDINNFRLFSESGKKDDTFILGPVFFFPFHDFSNKSFSKFPCRSSASHIALKTDLMHMHAGRQAAWHV